jgi:DNA-binding response OmpR family regulator
MSLSIHTPSLALRRTLEAIAALCQLPVVEEEGDYQLRQEGGSLHLTRQHRTLQSLACPARPEHLARMLTQHIAAALPSLAHDWQFDLTARHLNRDGQTHSLTEKEALLLQQLLQAFPQSASRETLLKEVWAMQPDVETHTLETHIYRLRSKLDALTPKPCDIITLDGAYQLTMDIA